MSIDDGKRSVKDYPGFWFREVEGWMGLLPKLEEMGGRNSLGQETNLRSKNP